MELRQLRDFVRVVELGSMGRAAADLGVVTSALSQQISRLENELSTRRLRTSSGVQPTDAGLAFWRQAPLARLSGHVSVGLAPSTASVLGLPLMRAMRERYPDMRLHLVESLSGHRASPKRTSRWRRWPTHTCAVATCSPACRTTNFRQPHWPRAW